ncbi:MAG: Hpt domain-containing protein [Gammaproteobacteria bacterium]|nr:Hpt domain-containing protein [Gammaproteobacteria bacterium]
MSASAGDFTAKLKEHYLEALPGMLDELESSIVDMENSSNPRESYFSIYRQIHSMKGSGGTYGFPIISTVCHQFEDYLSTLEKNSSFSRTEINNILAYADVLKLTCDKIAAGDTSVHSLTFALDKLRFNGKRPALKGLLIENSKINYELITRVLGEQMDINLSHCRDGLEALQRLTHEKFDFVITSREVSSLNGYAIIAATKLGSKVNQNIKAAVITSDDKPVPKSENFVDKTIHKDGELFKSITEFVKNITPQ